MIYDSDEDDENGEDDEDENDEDGDEGEEEEDDDGHGGDSDRKGSSDSSKLCLACCSQLLRCPLKFRPAVLVFVDHRRALHEIRSVFDAACSLLFEDLFEPGHAHAPDSGEYRGKPNSFCTKIGQGCRAPEAD